MATSFPATSPPARYSRSVWRGLGVGGGNMVYLDLRDEVKKRGREAILGKLEGILEIYEKFVGTDPLDEPMKIFPAVHYTMGGLWAGFTKDEKTGGLNAGAPEQHDDQHPRPLCDGRMLVRISRRQSPGGKFAALLHLRRPLRRHRASRTTAPTSPQSRRRCAAGRLTMRSSHRRTNSRTTCSRTTATKIPTCSGRRWASAMTDNCTVVRYNDPPGEDAGAVPAVEGALQKGKAFRHRHVDEPEPLVHPRRCAT